MKLTEILLDELEAEAKLSRRALENAPSGKYDWKPHEKSMMFGPLADMVANIPTWVKMVIDQDELDINPPGGQKHERVKLDASDAMIAALDKSMADARAAFAATNDAHLKTPWKLLAGGHVVIKEPRHIMIRDTIHHWVHHRGQMTVYLRLMGAKVPALYGPSADDQRF